MIEINRLAKSERSTSISRRVRGWVPALLAATGALALSCPADASPGTLTITPTFDSSITGAANAADIEAAINGSIGSIQGLYTTFVSTTDNVLFKVGPGSFLAQTFNGFFSNTYTDYTNALKADAAANPTNTVLATAIANLPKGNNSGGGSAMVNTTGQLRSLGFTAPPCFSASGDFNCGAAGHPFDAIVTLSSSQPLVYKGPISTTPPPVQFDAVGAIEHELNEVLGGGGAGSTLNAIAAGPCPGGFFCDKFGSLDLYRYSAPNTPSFTTSPDASSYFSVDGGATSIVGFNQDSGGDFADFGPNTNLCPGGTGFGGPKGLIQDAFSCNNEPREAYTTASPEYAMMLSVGYDPTAVVPPPVPEPGTLTLLASSLLGFAAIRRRRT